MLDLRRLRLLRELSERGTIAAVADALQFTPSAVSQQLAMLERETGVRLLERAGRGVRLTDAALVLVEHARALLERAAVAEAELAAAAGSFAGRARVAAFQSVALRLALPAMQALARDAPRLRCELVDAEPEEALPALALGDVDLVLADEWPHQPRALPAGLERHELLRDPVFLALPAGHAAARGHADVVPLGELAGELWTTGHEGMGWADMTHRTCRERGGFEPDIRYRTNDAMVALGLVGRGLSVALVPDLAMPERRPHTTLRRVSEDPLGRVILAVTRAADAARPSTRALLAALRAATAALPHEPGPRARLDRSRLM
jgi:DNA-binding transcriptional LysR family regulator